MTNLGMSKDNIVSFLKHMLILAIGGIVLILPEAQEFLTTDLGISPEIAALIITVVGTFLKKFTDKK